MSVIECDNVGIRYITGDLKAIGLKDYVLKKMTGNYHVQNFWADRNVTFKLEKGDMLGIIGSNGAGKSTLLKAVSGILLPAEGSLRVHGKVAALLELTSGFDTEMTVRENVFLRGALLHYPEDFLKSKYDEIIEFAELQEFQDHAFKQLSSGMRSRLAFSVACLVNPDILILDEVLSVGDGAFKKKSGDKMRSILEGGITGILVSHSINQIRELCNKILWLDHGNQIAFTDEVELYCDAYEEFLFSKKLPENRQDIEKMAAEFANRGRREREKRERKETEKLEKLLDSGSKETAVRAAVNLLRKSRPELLSEKAEEL